MAEQALDARSGAVLLRQRWRVLVCAGVVGLLLGLGYIFVVPAQLSSTALILLPGAEGSTTDGEIATQLKILESSPVLEQAGSSLDPERSLDEMRDRITTDATTSQVMEVKGSSTGAGEAQALAQAVADAYIAVLRNNARNLTNATRSDLSDRETELSGQLKKLQTEIDATSKRRRAAPLNSPAVQRESQLLAQLAAEQANVSLQLDKIKQTIVEYESTGTGSVTALLIQSADPGTGPGIARRIATWGMAGGFSAGALAAIVLLIRRRRDPRLRARDDLADAVGSVVIADVRSRPQRSVAEWLTFFESHAAPAVEAWAFRLALRALVPHAGPTGSQHTPVRLEHPSSVTVVSLAGDAGALAVGPQLAAFTASVGIITRCAVVAGHDDAAALSAACSSDRGSELRPGLHLTSRLEVVVTQPSSDSADRRLSGAAQGSGDASAGGARRNGAGNDPSNEGARRVAAEVEEKTAVGYPWGGITIVRGNSSPPTAPTAEELAIGDPASGHTDNSGVLLPRGALRQTLGELTILFAVIDREEPSLTGVPHTAATMLAISPGVGSREDLARLAVAVDDVGRRIDGIVVADPDPADRTSGRLTLDERVRREPLPMRTTGIGQLPSPSNSTGVGR